MSRRTTAAKNQQPERANFDFMPPPETQPAPAPAVEPAVALAVEPAPIGAPGYAEPGAGGPWASPAAAPATPPADPPPAAADPAASAAEAPARPAKTAAGNAAGATARRPKKRRRRATTAADDGTGVYLPVALRARLRAYARREGGSYTDVTLDAIEDVHDRLGELLTPAEPPRTGPLFSGRVRRRRIAHDNDPHVQVNLRLSVEDRDIVDEIAEVKKAANRSALIAAALDAFLPSARALGLADGDEAGDDAPA